MSYQNHTEYNPIIEYFKWLYRFCRRINLSREYSVKEYAGFMFAIISVASIAIYILTLSFAFFATQAKNAGSIIAISKTSALGDTIGGLSAPIIGIIASALSFLSFYMQYKANQGATSQFKNTSISENRDRFDRRLEALIQQNREIAKNMTIFDLPPEKTFVSLYKELKLSIDTVRNEYGKFIANRDIINIGYAFFYLGVGNTSNLLLRDLFKKTPEIIDALIFKFGYLQDSWSLNQEAMKLGAESEQGELHEILYYPFDGHQTRLGHYFRSYFHVLKFATTNCDNLFDFKQIYEKIKSLRTQTSTYEQILILANSQTVFGIDLIRNHYIRDFKLTKNIPSPMIRFMREIENPLDLVDHEWQKITERQIEFSL